jgi:hypothetical protein
LFIESKLSPIGEKEKTFQTLKKNFIKNQYVSRMLIFWANYGNPYFSWPRGGDGRIIDRFIHRFGG